MLHVTNGDAAAEIMQAAGIEGEILPWRDVLHEGPVPGGLDPAALRDVRARYIADRGWAPLARVAHDLEARDDTFAAACRHGGPLVLWFEHDLYDQLQLVQVLDRLAAAPSCDASLVQSDAYLGELAPAICRDLFGARCAIGAAKLDLGRRAWRAFTAPTPLAVEALRRADTRALPFLSTALRRLLEELPGVVDGLARSERQALAAIAHGRTRLGDLYRAAHAEREEALFLGDTVFVSILERMSTCASPLLRCDDGDAIVAPRGEAAEGAWPALWQRSAMLTHAGRDVLAGRRDHVALNGVVRWLGGTRLDGAASPWRWDPQAAAVSPAG